MSELKIYSTKHPQLFVSIPIDTDIGYTIGTADTAEVLSDVIMAELRAQDRIEDIAIAIQQTYVVGDQIDSTTGDPVLSANQARMLAREILYVLVPNRIAEIKKNDM